MAASANLVARGTGIVSGLVVAARTFALIDSGGSFGARTPDGSWAESGRALAALEGNARSLLSGERVALNFIGHLSGIATATRALVDTVAGTKARIVCTRKTTPGLRVLEKYAVRCGGGFHHPFGLGDAPLVKDNHLAAPRRQPPAAKRPPRRRR